MITKNDTLLLLGELQDIGVDVRDMLELAISEPGVNIDVVKFINKNRILDANRFYEKLRKSYNDKHSKLFINIVKDDRENPSEILTTLSALNLQILLFSKDVSDVQMFLRHTRFNEICRVLLNYSNTCDLLPCIKLLDMIKADIKAFQYFNKEK